MQKAATIFRHMIDNGPGTLAGVLERRDIAITQIDTFAESLDGFDPLEPDLLIVLGGACGVYQEHYYPFLKDEIHILKTRLAADRPTLGICLGAQLMAAALGASVYKGAGPELGWLPLAINEAGQATPLRHFDAALTPVMQWHDDMFDLPDDCVLLASTDKFPQQVFQWGKNGLAVQAHIEVDRKTVRSWCVNQAYALDKGVFDLNRIQNDTDKYIAGMRAQSEKFFHEWLDQTGV